MKVIVCNECNAEFKVKHGMDESYYRVEWCVFCGNELSEENKDEIESPEWSDEEQDDVESMEVLVQSNGKQCL